MQSKTPGTAPEADADQRRVAACVAACEGISTEALEDRVILKLIAACVHVKEPRVQEILRSVGVIGRQLSQRGPRT